MREVVGSLRDDAPTGPQPVLAQLDRLLGESDAVDVRLQVTGIPGSSRPGLELAGYRIVEHLLSTLEKNPMPPAAAWRSCSARTPSSSRWWARACAERGPAGARRRDRAGHLCGGTVRSSVRDGQRETQVLIPLTAGAV